MLGGGDSKAEPPMPGALTLLHLRNQDDSMSLGSPAVLAEAQPVRNVRHASGC